jgi:hypothetical protein
VETVLKGEVKTAFESVKTWIKSMNPAARFRNATSSGSGAISVVSSAGALSRSTRLPRLSTSFFTSGADDDSGMADLTPNTK